MRIYNPFEQCGAKLCSSGYAFARVPTYTEHKLNVTGFWASRSRMVWGVGYYFFALWLGMFLGAIRLWELVDLPGLRSCDRSACARLLRDRIALAFKVSLGSRELGTDQVFS